MSETVSIVAELKERGPLVDTVRARPELQKLVTRMRQGPARAHLLEYFRHRTRPNLIALLVFAAVPEAEPILKNLRACTQRRPCRMYVCPVCGKHLKAEAKDRALNRIVQLLGRFPKEPEISFVTIDGPQIDLDLVEVTAALTRFERKLDRSRRKHMRSTSWVGYFDVAHSGVLHWHGLVLHSELSRSELVNLLRRSFPDQGEVLVRKWHRNHSLAENLQNVLNYSLPADRHSRVYTRTDGPDGIRNPVHGEDSVKLIAKRIVVVQALAGRGVQGIRFIRNMKVLYPDIKVPELVQLERRTKKRINTKTMPNQEWAPRGVPGTHLRGKNPKQVGEREVPIPVGFQGCLEAGVKRGTEEPLKVGRIRRQTAPAI